MERKNGKLEKSMEFNKNVILLYIKKQISPRIGPIGHFSDPWSMISSLPHQNRVMIRDMQEGSGDIDKPREISSSSSDSIENTTWYE